MAILLRHRVGFGLFFVTIVASLLFYFFMPGDESFAGRKATPLSSLKDGVFFISPDTYAETVRHLIKKNAVFLPAPQTEVAWQKSEEAPHGYVGPESCRECHASYVESASMTAHYQTCRIADAASTPGSFEAGKNMLPTGSPDMFFEMTRDGDRFYQSLIVQRRGESFIHTVPIDLVTGSAKYGQTFLYWQQQCLYELPVSHFTDLGEWVNSPGYLDGVANFARPISSRCMECHSTWIEQSGIPFNRFNPEGAILGVTCEKCHGPGREHVEYHRSAPGDQIARHIINPGDLSPDRSIDLCSLCHSGAGESLKGEFTYRPGDKLSEFLATPPDHEAGAGGVHSANQQARMAMSRCFQKSSEMQCTTCHNPHRQERGNAALFIERCLKCHEKAECEVVAKVGLAAEGRCIDCHMPRRSDSMMPMQKKDDTFRPMLRDHFIKNWEDTTAEVLKEIAPGADTVKAGEI